MLNGFVIDIIKDTPQNMFGADRTRIETQRGLINIVTNSPEIEALTDKFSEMLRHMDKPAELQKAATELVELLRARNDEFRK